MRVGVVNQETWIFLQPIYEALSNCTAVDVYKLTEWHPPFFQLRYERWNRRRTMRRYLADHDVVLFEWASELLAEASSVRRPGDATLVTRLHRYEMFEWVSRIAWEQVALVILDTNAMRAKLHERTSMPPERTITLSPVGIERSKFQQQHRSFQGNIGILSSLIPRKRVYELLLAFHALLQRHPKLRLHIGGGPSADHMEYYEALHFLVRRLQIEDAVIFHGPVENRWDWYRNIDIFVSFSYSEGMQVAPLEAAASGCYCVSHGWEGADEIFGNAQLFMTEQTFLDVMTRYIEASPSEQAQMRQPLQTFVAENCNLETVVEEVFRLLRKAANSR